MESEEQSALLQSVATWLESAEVQQQEEGCLLLPINVLDLACSQQHPEVVQTLLTQPEDLRQAVVALLDGNGRLEAGQRLWLRPSQLMAAAELSVPQALECMRAAPGALFSCHGVCVATTAIFQKLAARSFKCPCCSSVCRLHSAAAPPPCCGLPLQEVEQARVMVQGQVIFLTATKPQSPAAVRTPHVAHSMVAVRLADDLCGRVRVGDRVLATGWGCYFGGSGLASTQAARLPVTLGTKMVACNIQLLRPTLLGFTWQLDAGAERQLSVLASGDLRAILQVLYTALPVAASPLLKLAVLLSAAASGTGSTQLAAEQDEEDPEPQAVLRHRAAVNRNQVHVMLTAAGPEPHIQRFLAAAAATLCSHSVHAAPADPRALLPSLDSKYVEPSLGLPVPLAVGGQLAEASPGVLLLSSSCLDAKSAIGLGQYMKAGEAVLHPGCLELCVPVEATLWTMMHEQDLSKSGRTGAATSQLSLTERIINRFSQPFFAQHDLLVSAAAETEEEVEDLADSILLGRAASTAAHNSGSSSMEQVDARAALQHHMQAARAQGQPVLSPEAGALLAAYFQHLRSYQEAQNNVLASMARVACASARLRHSRAAEALPDGALAVAYVEEKLLAAGASPLFWPRWRQELQRCTELSECLRGLLEDCSKGLGLAAGSDDGWLREAEE